MKWYRQLRWKLFVSHLLIGVIAVGVLIATAYFLTNVGFLRDMPASASQPEQGMSAAMAAAMQQENFQNTLRDALLVSAFAALEASLIVSLSASTRIVEPLHAISAVSRRLARGFYRERTVIKSDDELAELSRSVNQLAEALEQTEQRRMALLADVTHEIRTPLATIGGYMEGLLDGVIKPDEHTFNLVLHETTRLRRLIDDLQLLSRAEAGQIPISARPVNMRAILRNLVARLKPQCDAHQIKLSLVMPDSLPAVYADPDRVEQILINLLSNACRYTPGGGSVLLRAYEEEYAVRVMVEDSGVGIAPEHLPHLFERFYRVDKSRARASGGSGIGLTIARHLVYGQGGDIWVESDGPGHGSRFYFTLPRTSIDSQGQAVGDTAAVVDADGNSRSSITVS
jgi:histidine kinase